MSPTDSLGVSWPELISRIEPSGTFVRWRAAEPALASITGLDHLAAIVHHRNCAARADELLGALLRRAAADGGDDQDAALLVAHLLANGTRKFALQLADLADDIDDQIVATLWLTIRMFPWRSRTRAYANNPPGAARKRQDDDLPVHSAALGRRPARAVCGDHRPAVRLRPARIRSVTRRV